MDDDYTLFIQLTIIWLFIFVSNDVEVPYSDQTMDNYTISNLP